MDYETAVERLKNPQTWCQGAAFLAELGEAQALLPLLQAYESGYEGSRLCLLDAMTALEPVANAQSLFDSENPEDRRLMVHLMELFPDESHLARLEQAAQSDSPALCYQAGRSLVCQKQTAAWEETMDRLLGHEDARLRIWIIEGLGLCRREFARAALRRQLAQEEDGDLRAAIQAILERPL